MSANIEMRLIAAGVRASTKPKPSYRSRLSTATRGLATPDQSRGRTPNVQSSVGRTAVSGSTREDGNVDIWHIELRGDARAQQIARIEAAAAEGKPLLSTPGYIEQNWHEADPTIVDGHLVFADEAGIYRIVNRDSFAQVTVERDWRPPR